MVLNATRESLLSTARTHIQFGTDTTVHAFLGTGHWLMVNVLPVLMAHIGMEHAANQETVNTSPSLSHIDFLNFSLFIS